MGTRYIIHGRCPNCGYEDDIYYAPTCGFTDWECPRCGARFNLGHEISLEPVGPDN